MISHYGLTGGPLSLVPHFRRDVSSLIFKIGLVSQVQVLKVGVPDVEFEPSAPHGASLGFEFRG